MKAEVQAAGAPKVAAPKAAAAAVEASKSAAAAAEAPKVAAAGTVSVISANSVVRFGSIAEALENAKPSCKIEITGAHAGQQLIIPSQLKDLVVVGTGGASISASKGPAVQCSATGVHISGLTLAAQDGAGCVVVQAGGELTLTSCQVRHAAADGVLVMGNCRLEACKVLECGGYGVQALSGGVVDLADTSITLNTKTGLLARGAGSKVSLTAGSVVEKNKMHGVAADQGASFSALSSMVRENASIGFNLGDGGLGVIHNCSINSTGKYGIMCTGGTLLVSQCSISKARELGVFLNPPAPKSPPAAGGSLSASKCHISKCGNSGVVAKGGCIRLTESDVSDNNGFGVSLSEQRDPQGALVSESQGVIERCSITGNSGIGVHCSGGTCSLVETKVLHTRMPNPPSQGGGSGVASVLGGLMSVASCKIAQNATFGIFVNGGRILNGGRVQRASGVSVFKSSVSFNGTYGAAVAAATPEMPVRANLRIGAFCCDFSNNPQGPVEGDFSKEVPKWLTVGVSVGIVGLALLLVGRMRKS